MKILLISSLILNVVLLVIIINNRRAYHLLMKKNLKSGQIKDSLVFPSKDISYMSESVGDSSLAKLLIETMQNRDVYTDQNLNMQKLASLVGTNRTTLSHILNHDLHQTFSAFTNKYRIQYAVQLLSDSRYSKYKIETIGEMCGYANRQVFHSAFKKEIGITPTHFRKIAVSKTGDSSTPLLKRTAV